MKWWTVSIIKQPCFVMQISYFCLFKPSRKTHSASEHPVILIFSDTIMCILIKIDPHFTGCPKVECRASLKYVKCPKKDSVIKVSLESDLLFSDD